MSFWTELFRNNVNLETVTFEREDRIEGGYGETVIYKVFKAPNAKTAKAFLEENPVDKELFYIYVETPEGTYIRGIRGIFQEQRV